MKDDKFKDKRAFQKWMFPWLLAAVFSDITFFRNFNRYNTSTDLRILYTVNAVLFTSIAVYFIWSYQKKFGKRHKNG